VLYLAVRNLEDVGTVSPAQMDFTCPLDRHAGGVITLDLV
jgi:hypothetical protein